MRPGKNARGALALALLFFGAAAARCADVKIKVAKFDIRPSSAPVSRELRERINKEVPPESPPVVKSTGTAKSAIGPGFTLIPLPAYVFNRNEGSWIGGLTPIFRANKKGEVEDIFAPLYLHNKYVGETVTLNYFGYRGHSTQFHAILSQATKFEHQYELGYKDNAAIDGDYILGIDALTSKSAYHRFFGFGNNTVNSFETQHTFRDSVFRLTGGIHVSDTLSLSAATRYRGVSIEHGASPTLPQTQDVFPDVSGVADSPDVIGNGLTLAYDTRDNQLTPLTGTYATAFAEYDQNVQFQDHNRWWRLTGEARRYIPYEHEGFSAVFVIHAMADAVVGQDEDSDTQDTFERDTGQVDVFGNPIFEPVVSKRNLHSGVPFYERPNLGGENSLRGFGRYRYVDNLAYQVNLENRITLVQRTVMGNLIELEFAPFVDIGRVGRRIRNEHWFRRAQINPGAGLRVIARPNIAGRLDVGYGKDGVNAFVGLDYPF
ncbi:MAG: BamA/TamA family outer membrane protein [Elusimicrobia bacterium]|nr:BamA/TamA family outer membrane protein [Elusimicrobiota bacterium]